MLPPKKGRVDDSESESGVNGALAVNEHGVLVSSHTCRVCGAMFTAGNGRVRVEWDRKTRYSPWIEPPYRYLRIIQPKQRA